MHKCHRRKKHVRTTCTSVDLADLCIHVQNTHIQTKTARDEDNLAGADDGYSYFVYYMYVLYLCQSSFYFAILAHNQQL